MSQTELQTQQQAIEDALQTHKDSLSQLEALIATPAESTAPVSNAWAMPLVEISYFVATILFILGLKKMSSPVTARSGIVWAGVGMTLATLATFLYPGLDNFGLMVVAIMLGSWAAWWTGKRVAMTDMPQMIAVYNGLGGGAAACIAAIELLKGTSLGMGIQTLAVLGAIIGSVAFSGSMLAFAKLQGLLRKAVKFPRQQWINLGMLGLTCLLGIIIIWQGASAYGFIILLFFLTALAFGVMMTLPIGGADMPVVISLFNALTGLAVGFEGFVVGNPAMIIAGTVVGAAGTLLTQLMAKAMNRSLLHVLFSGFGTSDDEVAEAGEIEGTMKPIDAHDAGISLAYASQVIIVPGYGMAVAQAQHKLWELTKALTERSVQVKFAIHPVAGRMPGHMNVLLAEAGVPYDMIFDLDEINEEFPRADVALVIGANDVVNPAARKNPESPIYGMPILNVDQAQNIIVVKRGKGTGFSGVENLLFYADNTRMLYGDGQKMMAELLQGVKSF